METLAETPVPAEFSWFLEERFRLRDLALLHIIAKAQGTTRARVERVYLSRQEMSGDFLVPGAEVDFVESGGRLSSPPMLEVGDCALVFLTDWGDGHLYEASGFGHLLLEDTQAALALPTANWRPNRFPVTGRVCRLSVVCGLKCLSSLPCRPSSRIRRAMRR
jgi:hypothetical protein